MSKEKLAAELSGIQYPADRSITADQIFAKQPSTCAAASTLPM
jgi:hypothetical protein